MTNKIISSLFLAVGLLSTVVLEAQTCPAGITKTNPTSSYTLNGDGTATDNKTGLTWMRCSLGQTWNAVNATCDNAATTFTWKEALDTAESLVYANESDWRLPNIKELSSIVETACYEPAINEDIFPATVSSLFYWSSSPKASSFDGYIWFVTFNNGNDFSSIATDGGYVRVVRGGINQAPLNNVPIITNQPSNLGCTNGDTLTDIVGLSGITATDDDVGDSLSYTPSVNNNYSCVNGGTIFDPLVTQNYTITVSDSKDPVVSDSKTIKICPTGTSYDSNNDICF